MGLIAPILKALQEEGYTQPTPIQAQAIQPLLAGRDLLGCAQTGTGKTAAFALPILQNLYNNPLPNNGRKPIRTLILTPTRELAIQIEESLKAYGRHLPLRHLVIFGGVSQHAQVQALQRGVDVLVATPGRLLDLIQQGFVSLHQIEIFVLDEADRMLDMGFVHDVKRVITKLPAKRQTLFFSATMPAEIAQLANSILRDPVKVEVTPQSSTAEKVQQQLYFVGKNDKRNLLLHLLETQLHIDRLLVFNRTKHGANRIVSDLLKAGQTAEAIHGNKSQNARQQALQNFKNSKTRVLVATDIAARGIDIDDLGFVLNYDLPNIPETYVHRIGRTGRAGASGLAISFCEAEERPFLNDIQKLINKAIPVLAEHPFVETGNRSGATASAKNQQPVRREGNRQQHGRSGQPQRQQEQRKDNRPPRQEQRPRHENQGKQLAPENGQRQRPQPIQHQKPIQNNQPPAQQRPKVRVNKPALEMPKPNPIHAPLQEANTQVVAKQLFNDDDRW